MIELAMIIGKTPFIAAYSNQVETLPIRINTIQIERSPTDLVFHACKTCGMNVIDERTTPTYPTYSIHSIKDIF